MSGKDLDDFYGEDIEAEAVEQPAQTNDIRTRVIQFLTSPTGKKALILGAILCLGLLAIIVLVTLVIFWPASQGGDTDNPYTQDNSTTIDDGCDSTYGYSSQIAHQWKYGVIVDLGSSGSRIGVYQWTDTDIVQNAPSNGATYWYMEERPGVSSYAGDPTAAANSLIPLLDYAADRLLCVKVNQTQVPIFLYATAGLRLLPDSQAQEILSAIRTLVTTQYSFRFDSPAWCRIISGTEEASFDWLSVQQLFLIHGNLDGSKMANSKYAELDRVLREVLDYQSKGVVDLGGGSVEISFQPDQVDSPFDTDTFNSLVFNDTQYSVYGYSHLPYGHNEARKLVENALALAATPGEPVANPCYLVGYNATVNTTSAGSVYFYGTGNTAQCVANIQQIMPKDECEFSACSFNAVYQPLVEDSPFMALDNMARIINFYALSLNPVLVELYNSSAEFCQTRWEVAQIEYVGRPLDSILLQNYCFEGLYGFELLTWGFGFSETSQQIIFLDDLYGVTVSWALGAMVNQVDSIPL